MNTSNESILIGIEIIKAIENNDVEKMKSVLVLLQNFYDKTESIFSIEAIPFFEFYSTYNNDAFSYLINNCNIFIPSLEGVKIIQFFNDTISKYSKEELPSFIINQLENKTEFLNLSDNFFFELLFRLAMYCQDFSSISLIKQKILELNEEVK